MFPFLIRDIIFFEKFFIFCRDCAHVGKEYVHSLDFAKDSGSGAAFTPSEHYKAPVGVYIMFVNAHDIYN